jgi:hypothetical protein
MKKIVFLMLTAAALAPGASFYLTVAGLGGEADYEQQFSGWASDADKALAVEKGAKVETLSGANATRANIQAKLSAIAAQSKPADTFVLLLMGHGSFDDLDYKFNIPGQDISAADLKFALDAIPARQLVVLATSASGGAIERLKKDKRVVVAATRAGSERNATKFARFWVEALRDPAADADKNLTVTALEAYKYAQAKTQEFYKSQKRLATEHSVLEDTGKKNGEAVPSVANGQGLIATGFPLLHLGAAAAVLNDPAKQALLKRREEIETKIDQLKYQKASMTQSEYDRAMRPLVLDLARVQAEIDQ